MGFDVSLLINQNFKFCDVKFFVIFLKLVQAWYYRYVCLVQNETGALEQGWKVKIVAKLQHHMKQNICLPFN